MFNLTGHSETYNLLYFQRFLSYSFLALFLHFPMAITLKVFLTWMIRSFISRFFKAFSQFCRIIVMNVHTFFFRIIVLLNWGQLTILYMLLLLQYLCFLVFLSFYFHSQSWNAKYVQNACGMVLCNWINFTFIFTLCMLIHFEICYEKSCL